MTKEERRIQYAKLIFAFLFLGLTLFAIRDLHIIKNEIRNTRTTQVSF